MGLLTVVWSSTSVQAQDLVPGAYTPAPIGFNILTQCRRVQRRRTSHSTRRCPSKTRSRPSARHGFGIGRTLNIGGRFANIGVAIPFVVGHVEGRGARPVPGSVPDRVRATWRCAWRSNLYGAPAMTRQAVCHVSRDDDCRCQPGRGGARRSVHVHPSTSISARTAGRSGRSSGSRAREAAGRSRGTSARCSSPTTPST